MNCFSISVFVYDLRFKKYVCGNREDYTDKEIMYIKKEYEEEIKNKLDDMGYVN